MAWSRGVTTSARCAIVDARHPEAVRNLRKASRTAVGPVRPVKLNNLHKHSHGLLVSAISRASDLGLCLGLTSLRNAVLLLGYEVAFLIFRQDAGNSLPIPEVLG